MVSIAADAATATAAVIDLVDKKFASNEIGDVNLVAVTPATVSHVVLGRHEPHGGGWRLLFCQVPLPELLVPGPDLFCIFLKTASNAIFGSANPSKNCLNFLYDPSPVEYKLDSGEFCQCE